jgi:hypothetical protein
MFGKRKSKSTATFTPPSDQYRLKSNGRRVTLLTDLGNGNVRIAMDDDYVCHEDIVSIHDITPA